MRRSQYRRQGRRSAALVDEAATQWNVLHPSELVATFLLPLAERLPLPDGQAFPNHTRLRPDEVELLATERDALLIQRTDRVGQPVPYAIWEQFRGRGPVNWSNKWHLTSSTLVHGIAGETGLRGDVEPAFRVAGVVNGARQPASVISDKLSDDRSLLNANTLPTSRSASVAECAVGLRIVLPPEVDLPELGLDEAALEAASVAAGLRGSRDLRTTSWPWVVMQEDEQSRLLLLERAQAALDVAIADVQWLQRSSFAIRRGPRTHTTRERLPLVVPVLLRRHGDIGNSEPSPVDIVMVHAGPPFGDGEEDLSDVELSLLRQIGPRVDNGPFSAFLDLQREAWVALERGGDFRLATILAGTAAESLFDELLLHLRWEEGATPEAAAASWLPSLDSRVRTEFTTRLGGSWDARGTSPIADWSRRVAEVRHRVIHGGYVPSARQAHESFDAVTELITYLVDRLSADTVLNRYPRTAVALAGNEGLARRSRHTRRVRQLQDADEPVWWETFGRWREAWRRVMRDADSPRKPDEASASLLLVISGDGRERFCIHDAPTHLAAEVAPVLSPETTALVGSARRLAAPSLVGDAEHAISILIARSPELSFSLIGPWVEEYHFVPMTEVMVDRSDRRQGTDSNAASSRPANDHTQAL